MATNRKTTKTQTATTSPKAARSGRRSLSFETVNAGVQAALDGNTLWIKADVSKAKPSSTGKMVIVQSGGWHDMDGGIRFNLMAGKRAG